MFRADRTTLPDGEDTKIWLAELLLTGDRRVANLESGQSLRFVGLIQYVYKQSNVWTHFPSFGYIIQCIYDLIQDNKCNSSAQNDAGMQ